MNRTGVRNLPVYVCNAMRNRIPVGGYEGPDGNVSKSCQTFQEANPIYKLKLYLRFGREIMEFISQPLWSVRSRLTANLRELDILFESRGLLDTKPLWNKVLIWITEMLPSLRVLHISIADGLMHEILCQARRDYPNDVGQGLTRVFFSLQFFKCFSTAIVPSCDVVFNLVLSRRADGGPVAGPWSAVSAMVILQKIAKRCIERNRQAQHAMEVAARSQVPGLDAVRFTMPCHLGAELKRLASR